jgi:hypothetical protein
MTISKEQLPVQPVRTLESVQLNVQQPFQIINAQGMPSKFFVGQAPISNLVETVIRLEAHISSDKVHPKRYQASKSFRPLRCWGAVGYEGRPQLDDIVELQSHKLYPRSPDQNA